MEPPFRKKISSGGWSRSLKKEKVVYHLFVNISGDRFDFKEVRSEYIFFVNGTLGHNR